MHFLKLKQKLEIFKGLQFLGDVLIAQGDSDAARSLLIVALDGFTAMDVHHSRAECMASKPGARSARTYTGLPSSIDTPLTYEFAALRVHTATKSLPTRGFSVSVHPQEQRRQRRERSCGTTDGAPRRALMTNLPIPRTSTPLTPDPAPLTPPPALTSKDDLRRRASPAGLFAHSGRVSLHITSLHIPVFAPSILRDIVSGLLHDMRCTATRHAELLPPRTKKSPPLRGAFLPRDTRLDQCRASFWCLPHTPHTPLPRTRLRIMHTYSPLPLIDTPQAPRERFASMDD
ncbi:hypothetical protein FB451DRAFT_1568515 [Mycena latifolia]|nr:hypothetical protein FB451DRAFT_1568515 [Mycena latifolia]